MECGTRDQTGTRLLEMIDGHRVGVSGIRAGPSRAPRADVRFCSSSASLARPPLIEDSAKVALEPLEPLEPLSC